MARLPRPVSFYEKNAAAYFRSTAGIDPSVFLKPLAGRLEPGSRILDIGCGSGRDLRWLKERGYRVKGLEASPSLASLARNHAGCEVLVADFLSHDFSREEADALLLIGALVHLDKKRAGSALKRMLQVLSGPKYVLVSLKEGEGVLETADGRMFTLWSDAEARDVLGSLSLMVIEAFRQPSPVRAGDVWLSYLLQGTS